MNEQTINNGKASRIVSVDTLRGLTILLMIFVNDLGPAAPSWLLHIQPPDADGMTLADIVFPFFLFIVGMSIPLAFATAKDRGETTAKTFTHVGVRTLGLLLMGLVGVNRAAVTSLSPELWGLLCYVCILLAWCIVPKEGGTKRNLTRCLKYAGIVGLVILLALFRRDPVPTNVLFLGEVDNWTWLQTQWWGILGLIGWAYLVASCMYMLVGPRREWIAIAAGLLMTNFIVAANGGFFARIEDRAWLAPVLPVFELLRTLVDGVNQFVSIGSQLGSLPAIVICGKLLGSILLKNSDIQEPSERLRWALVYALLLFLAGAATDALAGVNKIAATPTWCFWCSSLAVLTWAILYWIMDVKNWTQWAKPIVPGGVNPHIAYLLHPIVLFTLSLTGANSFARSYAMSDSPYVTIIGSLVMAAVICAMTAGIARAGLRIRV
ncbi:MAG: DUF5009 domain-containing protein [Planctomycetota bacterium]